MMGNGMMNGTKNVSTATVSSSAKTLPNNLKLKLNGLVKSSKMLMGSKIGVGFTYLAKYPKPFLANPPPKYAMDVSKLNATVVLMLLVGAASSPSGISSSFHGTSAPLQLHPKMNKKMVVMYGTHGR